jgi:pimeloyl-ACP methyl ester carboxylesterase
MLRRVRAQDGVRLAYYEYSARPARAPQQQQLQKLPKHPEVNVFFSHATGFHGRIFDSLITGSGGLAEKYSCFSMDHRGHGQSGWNPDAPLHWDAFAADLLAVSHACCGTGPVVGVGHSMGAASLLMAALLEPKKFSALVLYEPIIFPPELRLLSSLVGDSPLARLARKRRNSFDSREEAIANFSKKPPMNLYHEDVLRDFVVHGLADARELRRAREGADADADADTDTDTDSSSHASASVEGGAGPSLHLRCERDREAAVYNSGSLHTTWSELPKVAVPCYVLSGKYQLTEPSVFAERLASRIPGSSFARWGDAGHFGPFEQPARFAQVVEDVIAELSLADDSKGPDRDSDRSS